MGRAQSAASYLILLATCTAGIFHLPWWSACAGACSLALMSLFAQRTAAASHIQIDSAIREPVLVVASVLNASAVASGAFVFGHVARWFWGL